MIHLSAMSTADSTLALSFGFFTRAGMTAPVAGLLTGMVSPAKSTNNFSPALYVWRRETSRIFTHARYLRQNWLYW
jgi:hypothetical protein